MKEDRLASTLFTVAGLYDDILGAAFLVAPAALLIVFAIMFFAVAANPRANRNLIPYGILLKVAYGGLVFGYWITQGLPDMWKPFAIADVAFAALFIWAWGRLAPA